MRYYLGFLRNRFTKINAGILVRIKTKSIRYFDATIDVRLASDEISNLETKEDGMILVFESSMIQPLSLTYFHIIMIAEKNLTSAVIYYVKVSVSLLVPRKKNKPKMITMRAKKNIRGGYYGAWTMVMSILKTATFQKRRRIWDMINAKKRGLRA